MRVVFVAERDALAIKCQQPVIGDGNAMRIAPEIAEYLRSAAEGWLGIDHPVLAMQAAQKFREVSGARKQRGPARRNEDVCADKDVSNRR